MQLIIDDQLPPSTVVPSIFIDDEGLLLLYNDIDDVLTTLHNATCLLNELKQELSGFLNTYYAKVGKWFVTLELVKRQIAFPLEQAAVMHTHEMTECDVSNDPSFDEILQKEMKPLYRKAVKLCHPDSSYFGRKSSGNALFRELHQVYLSGECLALWRLLKQLPADVLSQEYLKQLHVFHERLNTHIDVANRHISTLQKSPASLLKERVAESEAEGTDLIAEIVHQVQEKIADAKRILVQIKIHEMASVRRELLDAA